MKPFGVPDPGETGSTVTSASSSVGKTVYVHLLDGDALHLPDELQGFDVSWIGSQSKQTSVPCELVNQPVKVARLTR